MRQVHFRTGKLRIAGLSIAQEASFATATPLGASCTPWGANGPRLRLPAQVRAFDYLLKPVTYERLAQLLDELSSMRPAATDELVIKTSFGYHALRLSNIEYAEARNKHVVFHLRDGRDIEALESFRSVEDRLVQNATFFKCHRSYQVNLRNIDHFDRTDIVMRSGACIPLSRSCKQGFQDAYFAARFEGGRH